METPYPANRRNPLAAAPLVGPAVALAVGTWLGVSLPVLAPGALPLVAFLGLLGVALGRRRGAVVVALALALASGRLRAGPGPEVWRPDPARPVVAEGVVTGHARRQAPGGDRGGDTGSWSVPFRVERLVQRSLLPSAGRPRRVRVRPLAVRLVLPADGPAPRLGGRLRLHGYLARPAPLANLPATPPGPLRLKVKSRRLIEASAPPEGVAALSGELRARVEAALDGVTGAAGQSGASDDEGGERPGARLGVPVARALLLGDPAGLPPPVVRGLRRIGLGHLLAVSGLHVALAAALALFVTFPLGRRMRLLAVLAAVGLYLLLVGPRPSLVRAAAMAALAVAALLAERPPSPLNALAAAVAAMLLAAPGLIEDLGFRLTVAATGALLLLAPRLLVAWCGGDGGEPPAGERRRPLRWLAAPLAASVAAQLGTMPFALPTFHLLPLVGPLANLVAVPWAAVAVAASAPWVALAVASPAAAGASAPLLDLLAAPAAWPARLAPSPWLSLPVAVGPLEAAAVAALFAFVARWPRRAWPLAGAAALLLVPPAGIGGAAGRAPAGPLLVAIDVGQGDALLLADGRRAMLVDGGGWPAGDLGGRVLLPVLAAGGWRRLDAVLMTHSDRDHCGGLLDLGGHLDLGMVLTGPGGDDSGGCAADLLGLPGVGHRTVAAGDRWRLGRWQLEVLHPERGPSAGAGGRERAVIDGGGDNDASVVVRAAAYGRRLLLTGDVEAAAERRLLERHPPTALEADLLKVAHHGSRTSTTPPFLSAVAPRLALVSAGWNNPYRHPAAEVVERLRRARATVLRTDRQGMVVVEVRPDGALRLALPAAAKRLGAPERTSGRHR